MKPLAPARNSLVQPIWRDRPGRVITPMGLALALSLLGDATLYTVLPTHTAEAGIALGGVGVILGVNRAVRLLLNTPAGMLYDRLPRRWIYLPASAIGVLSTIIYALSGSFWPLLAGRLLWGLAWSGLWVGANAITLDLAGSDNRGRLMGWTQAWFFLGGALSFLVGGYLTDLFSYRLALWVGAGLSAIGLLAAALFLPETWPGGPRQPETTGRVLEAGQTGTASRELATGNWRDRLAEAGPALRHGGWLALYAYGVLRFCMAGVLSTTLSLFVAQRIGNQVAVGAAVFGVSTLTGILLGARPLVSLATAPWAGNLSDLRGRQALLRWGALIGAASFLLLARGSLPAIIASGLLGSLAMGMLSPITSALVGDLAPAARQGHSLGWLATAGDFGSAIGPIIAYALLPVIGLSAVYLISAVLMASIWAASLAAGSDAKGSEAATQPVRCRSQR